MAPDLNHTTWLLLLGGLWALYFALHSLLASLWVKRRVARLSTAAMRVYRLAFNLQAVVLLLPPLWLTFAWPGPMLWRWEGPLFWVANGLALVAVGLFLWSLRFYDGGEFLGLRQLREGTETVEDQESLKVSPMHRFVRHPWYSLGLVLVWTRDMDAARLVTALVITAYLVIGSRLEERKLKVYHGRAYEDLMKRVPGLIPRPWRYLSRDEAEAINRRS